MKILIAGDGKVGATLTRQLSAEGYDLTLIDSNQKVLDSSVERYDVMAVHGNCASMDVLLQAGVQDADLLIAATSADEVNLLCCMTAHGINPNLHTIARIRNPEYTEQIYVMRETFALSLSVNPERQAAEEIERLLKYPGFLKRDTFAKGRVQIVELRVDGKSKLKDLPLSNLDSTVKCKVLVCAVLRNGATVPPNGSCVLQEGDRVFVTAPAHNLEILLKSLGIITRKVNRVILTGGGRVSFYLSQLLLKSGITVQLIEQDEAKCQHLSERLPNACIVHGDASNQTLLEREGVDGCDALVNLTGLDELNIILSLYGSSHKVPLIITKLGHVENFNILDNLPLGSIICPKELCCNTIVRYVRAMQNQTGAAITVHSIADGKAEATEFLVDASTPHCGEPLKNIKTRQDVLIACISHGPHTVIPDGNTSFNKGDSLIIVTSGNTVIHQLSEIFE